MQKVEDGARRHSPRALSASWPRCSRTRWELSASEIELERLQLDGE